MSKYTVRSGQNIYDVALSLHGSVEGIFDLLNSNPKLSLDTVLKSGDVLEYNELFEVNADITAWLEDNGIRVKNGNHSLVNVDVRNSIIATLSKAKEVDLSDDDIELEQYYDEVTVPEIIIQQLGKNTTLGFQVDKGSFVAVGWGDDSDLEFYYYTDSPSTISHIYEDDGQHLIKIYGTGDFVSLDFTNINGIYYALRKILISESFSTSLDSENINKLFIIKGQK